MRWETVIGLETHVELATKTKIFCGCTTEFGGAPNTHCCPVCTGMPGTLPVLNRKVVEYAVKAGLALNCEITRYNKFDRKNYFYPDLPKAYQISQLYLPVCRNGHVTIEVDGVQKDIRIHEIHMEEDAGKLVHDPWTEQTQCDYNRCGVPLIEIVTEPDFRSAAEVLAYLEKLKSTLEYLGVSDCKMQEGSLRADINLSVRPVGQAEFGTRTEMKNLNSFKAIGRAIEYEAQRQIEELEDGGRIIQQTRRWDDNKDRSIAMRSKENAQDYRYFPEPDLPPLELSEEWIAAMRDAQPEMAEAKKARYMTEFGLPEYDARLITAEKPLADLFEDAAARCGKPKAVANWIMGDVLKALKDRELEAKDLRLTPENLARIITLVEEGQINRKSGQAIFAAAMDGPLDVDDYVQTHGMAQVRDTALVEQVVAEVFAANPQSLADYQAGKTKAVGFLVGQTMKQLKGKADPQVVNQVIADKLAAL
jgi:aspartyl-tRNA(Asn)/glutamyl-tRNA(Gln) amidotransferase subunit B